MRESHFLAQTEALFLSIEAQIDAADIGVEPSLNEGVLELEFENDSKIIINRHIVNQEVWIAAKGGGFHYQLEDNTWKNTRTGKALLVELAFHISQQSGEIFDFEPIA
jgi:CyaY protein